MLGYSHILPGQPFHFTCRSDAAKECENPVRQKLEIVLQGLMQEVSDRLDGENLNFFSAVFGTGQRPVDRCRTDPVFRRLRPPLRFWKHLHREIHLLK
jgi:hypothetical protein